MIIRLKQSYRTFVAPLVYSVIIVMLLRGIHVHVVNVAALRVVTLLNEVRDHRDPLGLRTPFLSHRVCLERLILRVKHP